MLYPFGFLSSSGFIIDTIGVSAAAAYGLRKLRSGYTGSAWETVTSI